MSERSCEKELLTIERKRLYNKIEQDRPKYYNDIFLVEFANDCISNAEKFNDFRYLNLALKINDSDYIKYDKKKLSDLLLKALNDIRSKIAV